MRMGVVHLNNGRNKVLEIKMRDFIISGGQWAPILVSIGGEVV